MTIIDKENFINQHINAFRWFVKEETDYLKNKFPQLDRDSVINLIYFGIKTRLGEA